MLKYKIRFLIPAAWILLTLPAVAAETWHLDRGEDWRPLSAESEQAFSEANKFFSKGKFIKAVRSFDKFLDGCNPESELYAQALERQFSIAKEYLAGRKIPVLGIFRIKGYATGIKIMEGISRHAGEATIMISAAVEALESHEEKVKLDKARAHLNAIGMQAAVAVAEHYEGRGKIHKAYYNFAYLKWLEISDTYKELREDALLGMARCRYAAYKGSGYDSSILTGRALGGESQHRGARHFFREFISSYPEDAEKLNIDVKLKDINEQLACKDLDTGMYYQRTGNKQAANLYYQMIIRDWPGTKAAEIADQMLVMNLSGEEVKK